jgi:hypothetical protein
MRILLLFLALVAGLASAAEQPRFCVVCEGSLSQSFYKFNSPTLGDKQPVCESCFQLKGRCFTCKLPVPASATKTDDGRVFCTRDFRAGVFNPGEARRIYEEARRDIAGLLAGQGTMPDRSITVTLVSGTELTKEHKSLLSNHDAATLGLTRSETLARRQFQHHVYLLNGLPPAQLAAVCAHEYTHAWLVENLPEDRKLDRDTIEGFCELVAYKLMVQRRDETQKKAILANAYTRGQVNAFVQSEQEHAFHRIVKWMKTGVDEMLAPTNNTRVLEVRDGEPGAPLWPPPAATKTKVPDTLMLKGISGAASRRFALINDTTLLKNEEGKVRVGSSNVLVRCLDIREKSVLIQVRGTGQPTELFLANSE